MAQEIINAAPVDGIKKSKKDRKSKKIEANGTGNGEAVAESSSKKEKKDKKRKREEKVNDDADEDEEDKADPSLLRAAPVSTTEEQVNGDGEDKKEKNTKKRKLEAETGEAVNGDGEERKKKKKEKKEKKEKKANGGEVAETAAPAEDVEMKDVSADAPVEKSEKKEKKKDKKDKKAKKENGAAPTTASSSKIALTGTASPEVTKSYLEKHNITLTPTIYNILNSFASLPINPDLRPYLSSFKEPTPIQACSWPPLFEGKDVVGIAETGSGKTLAFGLPGLNALSTTENPTTGKQSKSRGGKDTGKIRLLVVAPTRELATQTFQTLEALGKLVGITAVCL